MKYIQSRTALKNLLLFFISCFIISCIHPTPEQQATALKQRATEYWKFRVNGEHDKAFAFELPQTVEGVTLNQYRSRFGQGVMWLAAEPEDVTVNGDEAKVTIKIRYRWSFTQDQPEGGFENTTIDRWKLLDGTWYHMHKKSPMPAPREPQVEAPKTEEQPVNNEKP